MKEDLKKLYSKIIRTHNESPFHFEKMENAQNVIRAFNPVCGDRFEVYVTLDPNTVKDIYFHGFGCAISKASTSILVKSLEGKTAKEGLRICEEFLGFIGNEVKGTKVKEDFKAFSGVHDFPDRKECATLSWMEMRKFLQSIQTK